MRPDPKQTRLLHVLAILLLCIFVAGCEGRAGTLYSPPEFGDAEHPPAVRIIAPAEGATFHAHADIRLRALATPHGTDLGPVNPADLPFPVRSDKWELMHDPEDAYSVEFFADTNSLGARSGGLVSARVRSKPGQATPFIMAVIGYPAVELIWHNAPAGSYTLTAKATNEKGLATVSTAVNITVQR
ncbi:MAG TPA: hypothetical protein VED19_01265 [Candidatus Nitrosopolaris sp.]|nr:hypothetical protein [Candidatus Nitrosopolaris sp.]